VRYSASSCHSLPAAYYLLLAAYVLFKVFSDEAHMSGSEIDDGTDTATAWKRRLNIIILKLRE
jgi:hypothetical protein